MSGKRKAEDISEEPETKQHKDDKKEENEEISGKEEENGETGSPLPSSNNDNKNGSQEASAGIEDKKDVKDLASFSYIKYIVIFSLIQQCALFNCICCDTDGFTLNFHHRCVE